MKRTRIFMMAFASMLIGLVYVSCEKDDHGTPSGTEDSIPQTPDNPGQDTTQYVTVNWIDLGLPSGLLWAECNLGANAPEEYGNYYAWAETNPKEVYNWNTYKYCTVNDNGFVQTLTKYNNESRYGTCDNLTSLETMDDAAAKALGNGARTPTVNDWVELIENTTVEWDTLSGVTGRKFTATNGNSIFLPAAGYRHESELKSAGSAGYYWSDSLYYKPLRAASFTFGSNYQFIDWDFGTRLYGYSVRAVRQN